MGYVHIPRQGKCGSPLTLSLFRGQVWPLILFIPVPGPWQPPPPPLNDKVSLFMWLFFPPSPSHLSLPRTEPAFPIFSPNLFQTCFLTCCIPAGTCFLHLFRTCSPILFHISVFLRYAASGLFTPVNSRTGLIHILSRSIRSYFSIYKRKRNDRCRHK